MAKKKMPENYAVIVGSVFEENRAIGPFTDHDEAMQWAEKNIKDSWCVVPMTAPKDY